MKTIVFPDNFSLRGAARAVAMAVVVSTALAVAVASAVAQPVGRSGVREYVVQPGGTSQIIAQRDFKNGGNWQFFRFRAYDTNEIGGYDLVQKFCM